MTRKHHLDRYFVNTMPRSLLLSIFFGWDSVDRQDPRQHTRLTLCSVPSQAQPQIPPFDIIPVSPEDGEIWETLWPDDDGDLAKQEEHAYKALNADGGVNVYFSTVFTPYKSACESLTMSRPARAASFDTHYQVWIGYHAILQAQRQQDAGGGYDGTSEELLERLQEVERQTVGKVQVRQALKTAELLEVSLKTADSA